MQKSMLIIVDDSLRGRIAIARKREGTREKARESANTRVYDSRLVLFRCSWHFMEFGLVD